MRILYISDVYFPRVNGVSTSMQTFWRELQRLGHDITVIAPDYGQHDANDTGLIRILGLAGASGCAYRGYR